MEQEYTTAKYKWQVYKFLICFLILTSLEGKKRFFIHVTYLLLLGNAEKINKTDGNT